MKWTVYKKNGTRRLILGTIDAANKTAAVVAAVERFRNVGLSAANVEVKEKEPEY